MLTRAQTYSCRRVLKTCSCSLCMSSSHAASCPCCYGPLPSCIAKAPSACKSRVRSNVLVHAHAHTRTFLCSCSLHEFKPCELSMLLWAIAKLHCKGGILMPAGPSVRTAQAATQAAGDAARSGGFGFLYTVAHTANWPVLCASVLCALWHPQRRQPPKQQQRLLNQMGLGVST